MPIDSATDFLFRQGAINKAIYWSMRGMDSGGVVGKLADDFPMIGEYALKAVAAAAVAALSAGAAATIFKDTGEEQPFAPPVITDSPTGRWEYTIQIDIRDKDGKIIKAPTADRIFDRPLTKDELDALLDDLYSQWIEEYQLEGIAESRDDRVQTIVGL